MGISQSVSEILRRCGQLVLVLERVLCRLECVAGGGGGEKYVGGRRS